MLAENIILSVKDLQIAFAGDHALKAVKGVSFQVAKGKTLAIVGESGSGKSLTALALMGLLPKTALARGELSFRSVVTGFNATGPDFPIIRGRDIGMVFQEPMSSMNPVMKIGKQLAEAIGIHQKLSAGECRQYAVDWLSKVQLPDPAHIYHRYPHELSGGQKQRVMIAMAMCNHPSVLIADEPTTALDATVQQEIIRLMHYLQHEHQSAMIFITHDLGLAATIADDVLVMYQGEMMEYGSVSEVLERPRHPYTKALLACKPSPDRKGHRLPVVADFLNETGVPVSPPPTGGQADPGILPTPVKPLVVVSNLRVWFPEHKNLFGKPASYFKAVDDVSFEINNGEVLGLVGESGCGKSTLSRTLTGLLPVHSGAIHYKDKDLAKIRVKDWVPVRMEIQMIFQDPYSSLNPRMTIGDMLMEPLMVHDIVPRDQLRKEAIRLLDLVQLASDAMHRYPHQFSGGQRQRIGIARALALRPKLLICDESVSALDVSIQAQILNLLKDLQREFQLTYLFISHDLSVVHYISDRVMVMQAGKIVETGNASQVLHHPKQEYTRQLINAMPQPV